ncbi:hypothetical protein Bbelb_292170 [Branchiostoma belcheri]|nr:hypothetical protein Bbelb_292170 [Branchiostoma belcheri]
MSTTTQLTDYNTFLYAYNAFETLLNIDFFPMPKWRRTGHEGRMTNDYKRGKGENFVLHSSESFIRLRRRSHAAGEARFSTACTRIDEGVLPPRPPLVPVYEEAEEGQHFPNVAKRQKNAGVPVQRNAGICRGGERRHGEKNTADADGRREGYHDKLKDMMAALLDHYLYTKERSTSSSTTWSPIVPQYQTVALNHTDVCTEAHSVTWYGVGETLVAFTDSASHQVKVVMQSGQVQTLAGNGRPGLQDGTLPFAEFHQPRAAFYGHMATKVCSKCLKPFSRNSDNRVDYSGFEEEDP